MAAALGVAFLGTHNWRAHEAVRWWSAAHGQEERAAAEGDAAAPQQLDVFGVARAPLDLQRALVWHGLRPGDDTRVARAAGVGAVVCSGHGPNDVTIVKDCLRAGKAVFVESLERFQPADLAEIGAAAGGEAEGCRPALMSGLYLRFDTVMQEAVEVGIESLVGRPLLYRAHASAADPATAGRVATPFLRHHRYAPVTPSLYEMGVEQVDALRCLLKAEPREVYAVGALPPGASREGTPLGAYQAVTLTINTSDGVPAVIALDTCGGSAPRQRISVVGDTNRVTFAGVVGAAELQEAGINHFLDVVTEGCQPQLSAADCLAAAAVMAAAEQSLRTGAPVAVKPDWACAAAAPAGATATVTLAAASAAASKLAGAAAALVGGARQVAQGGRKGSGTSTPPEEGGGEEEERVSTPPHQGTPPPKSVSTPESPALLPSSHLH